LKSSDAIGPKVAEFTTKGTPVSHDVLERLKSKSDRDYSWDSLFSNGSPHPELDGAFAPNLEQDDPINRCSAYFKNGDRKPDILAAVEDARKVRSMTPTQRDAEIRRCRRPIQ
jgi:hypothetical protein